MVEGGVPSRRLIEDYCASLGEGPEQENDRHQDCSTIDVLRHPACLRIEMACRTGDSDYLSWRLHGLAP
jgi:hypothetical protein